VRDSKATGWNTPASSGCSRMAETASSEASVSRRVGRAESHTRMTAESRKRGGQGGEAEHKLAAVTGETDEAVHVGA
jgi:hypothetical protein